MNVDFRYLGQSSVLGAGQGLLVRFSPNLARPKTFFDGALKHPIRFREAVSALHDVVVGDLKWKRKDRTAYREWLKAEAEREEELKKQIFDEAKRAELAKIAKEPIPVNLEADFRKMHRIYWDARVRWANELARNDPELFRHLVPCDPVVTVAPDVVFFECFSKDESSYGCLSVDREAFEGAQEAGLGTTNVDYSLALYDHFQTLRSYRQTRLSVDPSGFEVKVEGNASYREEKIDLPPSWLRGFGQIQASTCLPSRRVELDVAAVYAILAHLKRHREKVGPRSLRFLLTPGKPPVIVLDPWGIEVTSRGPVYDGGLEIGGYTQGTGPYRSAPAPRARAVATEEIKVWGRRRLFALARLLPLAESVEVRLLGSGLPSIWIAKMGEMRLVLALSGWTANDWTSGSGLDLLAGSFQPDERAADRAIRFLQQEQRATLSAIAAATGASEDGLIPALHMLAKQGQLIYDHADQVYRYRQVMPVVLSESVLGPEHPELVEGRIIARTAITVDRDERLQDGRRAVVAKAKGTSCEAIFDADLAFKKAKCTCSYFHKNGLRAGPCRHLLALRLFLSGRPSSDKPEAAIDARGSGSPRAPFAPNPKPELEPAAPAKKGSKWSTGERFAIPREILDELRKQAGRRNMTISRLFEEAWDLSGPRIQGARSWTEALSLVDGQAKKALAARSVAGSAEETLALHPDVLAEVTRVADKFRAERAAVLNLAWLIATRSS